MTTVMDMIRRVESLDYTELVTDAMIANSDDIVQLNREQMSDGINSVNQNITPYYSKLTIEYKQAVGQPYDRVTLKDTGEFYSKMFLKIQGGSFDISSSDSKTPDLVKKYSKKGDIFGLTSESKRISWTEIIAPNLIRAIKNATGLQ